MLLLALGIAIFKDGGAAVTNLDMRVGRTILQEQGDSGAVFIGELR